MEGMSKTFLDKTMEIDGVAFLQVTYPPINSVRAASKYSV